MARAGAMTREERISNYLSDHKTGFILGASLLCAAYRTDQGAAFLTGAAKAAVQGAIAGLVGKFLTDWTCFFLSQYDPAEAGHLYLLLKNVIPFSSATYMAATAASESSDGFESTGASLIAAMISAAGGIFGSHDLATRLSGDDAGIHSMGFAGLGMMGLTMVCNLNSGISSYLGLSSALGSAYRAYHCWRS